MKSAPLDKSKMNFHLVSECDAYRSNCERFLRLFRDFGDWDSPVAQPSARDLAGFMQQRQPLVAAFIDYCFLSRVDAKRADEIVPVDLSVSETDLNAFELVEVSN
jgi:hypothetical protein